MHQSEIDYNLTKLSLKERSSSAVADTAKKIDYHIDVDQCLQDLVQETSAGYIDFEPKEKLTEDKLLQQFVKHFTGNAAKLCLIDTHLSAPLGMTKKPDAIIVRKEAQHHKSALSIICVIELKKENQLNTALGQVIKDMMELVDLQPKRTIHAG
jgi:hypothetical protein